MESDGDILVDEVFTVVDDIMDVRETVGPSSSKRNKKGAATYETTYDTLWETGFPIRSLKEINTLFCASLATKLLGTIH